MDMAPIQSGSPLGLYSNVLGTEVFELIIINYIYRLSYLYCINTMVIQLVKTSCINITGFVDGSSA